MRTRQTDSTARRAMRDRAAESRSAARRNAARSGARSESPRPESYEAAAPDRTTHRAPLDSALRTSSPRGVAVPGRRRTAEDTQRNTATPQAAHRVLPLVQRAIGHSLAPSYRALETRTLAGRQSPRTDRTHADGRSAAIDRRGSRTRSVPETSFVRNGVNSLCATRPCTRTPRGL